MTAAGEHSSPLPTTSSCVLMGRSWASSRTTTDCHTDKPTQLLPSSRLSEASIREIARKIADNRSPFPQPDRQPQNALRVSVPMTEFRQVTIFRHIGSSKFPRRLKQLR